MLIDQTHRRWLWGSVIGMAVATLVYIPYDHFTLGGARGGTVLGIIYGVVGFAFMIFAGLLSLRKKFPVWRIGRTSTWMRGHLWLGLISFPIILFHSGFSFGHGTLTSVMMVLFTVVIVSGILGAVFQHYMPRMMTQQVPYETIYAEMPRIRAQLLDEADMKVAEITGVTVSEGAMAATAGTGGVVITLVQMEDQVRGELTEFYDKEMRPYIEQEGARGCVICKRQTSKAMFDNLRTLVPEIIYPVVDDLESICEEKRQLDRQVTLHRALHGWLFVHIPLSLALLALGLIHAVIALRY